MSPKHLEVLCEDRSMEEFLQTLLVRTLVGESTFAIHSFQGKNDLLKNLPYRLRGYSKWIPENYRIVVVLDRDDDDCKVLKSKIETIATESGLITHSQAGDNPWQVVNRIAIEELEAWYFGDWEAVCKAFPRVPPNIPNRAPYRNPDSIQGGTWESFERVMKRYGYFKEGLRKVAAAQAIAIHIDPARSRSTSFKNFYNAIVEATV